MNKLKKIIEYGIYALVFLLPWQTKLILRAGVLGGGDWEFGTIALYGIDILLVVLLILFAIKYFLRPKSNKPESLSGPHSTGSGQAPTAAEAASAQDDKRGRGFIILLSGLDFFVFISVFFAPDFILAAYRYLLFLLGLELFWLIVKVKYDNKKLAAAFFSGLLIQSGLAIWQFLNQGTFANKWLGMALHNPSDLGTSVIETVGAGGIPERWLRAYGSLDHPNVLGGLLAVGLIILIYCFINLANKKQADKNVAETDPSRGAQDDKNNVENRPTPSREARATPPEEGTKFLIFNFSFLILFVALIFTFSRSAALALVVGIILFFIFYIIKKDSAVLKKLGLAVFLAAVMFGVIFAGYSDLFITRAQISSRLEIKSVTERSDYLKDSYKIIKKDWLFGTGVGNYTKELARENPKRAWFDLEPVHNVFLLVFSEIGIGGVLFFIALFVYLFIQSWRKNNILNLSIIAALAIMMMFDHYLWSLPFGVLFFWLAIGFVYKNLNKI